MKRSEVGLREEFTVLLLTLVSEAVAYWCSVKDMFFKTLQNSKVNNCSGFSFLIKLHAFNLQFYEKKILWLMCFPVSFFKNTDFTEHVL